MRRSGPVGGHEATGAVSREAGTCDESHWRDTHARKTSRSKRLSGVVLNGRLKEGTLVVEASSGSTAISEAYFARLLRLPFVAVVPASTSKEKLALIEAQGGRCHLPIIRKPRSR
jgi:cysteine synthase A